MYMSTSDITWPSSCNNLWDETELGETEIMARKKGKENRNERRLYPKSTFLSSDRFFDYLYSKSSHSSFNFKHPRDPPFPLLFLPALLIKYSQFVRFSIISSICTSQAYLFLPSQFTTVYTTDYILHVYEYLLSELKRWTSCYKKSLRNTH